MKNGPSKQQLKQRLRQKMTESADLQLDSLASELESFTSDIRERATSALHTTSRDMDALTQAIDQRISLQMQNCELWTEKANTAAELMKQVRIGWIRDGLMTLLAPMMVGAMISGIAGVLIALMLLPSPPQPTSAPSTPRVEVTTGLGGIGQVFRHPPGSEVVPCPLRSRSGSVCVRSLRESQ
ncbi:hypothetical protein A8B78_08000 [Jannaschia sp. EhC01]|nr:hypothetical protein A8B78_08000 [Jannaschia sp. EhC01]